MVCGRSLRLRVDMVPDPDELLIPGFVERQFDAADFTPPFAKELAVYRVTWRGLPERQIVPGDLLFVDLERKQPGLGQPAVFTDGTLQVFSYFGEVQGSVVGVFRRVARQV